ncbi:YciI family protein [Cellulomonas sp. KRMCY2]|uniref:YciI family protein n=1 Tax=Cellulomonas sp. KRMCY2 TaxID=1304865 RepID=UPI00045EB9A3|nr:YciI family protein [Cellulomonas sp. KRMCY2]
MTQYLLSVHGSDADPVPDNVDDLYAAVDRFNADLQRSGSWVFAGGLHPAHTATVVDATRTGDPVVTDGPYLESKEHLGGFWIVDVPDLDAALELARRGSAACAGPVEVRPFQDEPQA